MSKLEDLRHRIDARDARIGVIGLGYVGLPLALELANTGFRVTGFDIDPEKLPGQNRIWRQVKHELSYYHFPSPALRLTPTTKGIAWYR